MQAYILQSYSFAEVFSKVLRIFSKYNVRKYSKHMNTEFSNNIMKGLDEYVRDLIGFQRMRIEKLIEDVLEKHIIAVEKKRINMIKEITYGLNSFQGYFDMLRKDMVSFEDEIKEKAFKQADEFITSHNENIFSFGRLTESIPFERISN